MAEKLVLPGALDKLAKLLAAENIAVEHAPVVTASFDVKNRVLRLPMWQEMTESLYHLLVLHEVGHALETPYDGWKSAIDAVEESDGHSVSRTFQGYLNVVEDARIERKIKAKFPGSRRDFHDGYKWLFESDFFNVKSTKPDKLSTIDRINLYFKVGSHMQVPFSSEEQVFVKRAEDIHTWDEAVTLANDLLAFAKEKAKQEDEENNEDMRDVSARTMKNGEEGEESDDREDDEGGNEAFVDDGDPESDSDEDGDDEDGRTSGGLIEEATTDKALADKMQDLVDPKMLGTELRYVVFPKDMNSSNFIVKYGDILKFAQHDISLGKSVDYQAFANRVFSKFRSDNNNAINYMVKDFEMKKAATAYSRSKQSKTGTIDTTKIHSYKFSEDIFRRLTILPEGKNHGLVVYLDMSGSMSGHIRGAVEQMITLATFCRRVNIPHRIYGFSTRLSAGPGNNHPATKKFHDMRVKIQAEVKRIGMRLDKDFVYPNADLSLLELFHEGMNLRDFNFMCSTLLISGMIQNYAHSDLVPRGYHNANEYVRQAFFGSKHTAFEFLNLGATPFNDSLMLARDIITKFTKEKNLEIVNMVTITDGESDPPTYVHYDKDNSRDCRGGFNIRNNRNRTVFLTDELSRRQIRLNFENIHQYTSMYAKLIRDTMKVNLVGFYITNNARDVTNGATVAGVNWLNADLMVKSFRSNQYAIVPGLYGHNEFYYIKGGKSLRTEGSGIGDIAADATKGKLKTAFANAQTKRGASRVVLAKFIDRIAV